MFCMPVCRGLPRLLPVRGVAAFRAGQLHRATADRDHDGRFADLPTIVAHHETALDLQLTPQERADPVAFLKSL